MLHDKDTDQQGLPFMENMLTLPELDEKIQSIERRLRLTNKQAPTFSDIMLRVDKILEDSPLAVKQVFEPEANKKTTPPLVENYDQHDFLWKKFGFEYDKIYPKYVKELRIKKGESLKPEQATEDVEEDLFTTKNTNPFAKTMTVILTEDQKEAERNYEIELKEIRDEDIRVTPLDE